MPYEMQESMKLAEIYKLDQIILTTVRSKIEFGKILMKNSKIQVATKNSTIWISNLSWTRNLANSFVIKLISKKSPLDYRVLFPNRNVKWISQLRARWRLSSLSTSERCRHMHVPTVECTMYKLWSNACNRAAKSGSATGTDQVTTEVTTSCT